MFLKVVLVMATVAPVVSMSQGLWAADKQMPIDDMDNGLGGGRNLLLYRAVPPDGEVVLMGRVLAGGPVTGLT